MTTGFCRRRGCRPLLLPISVIISAIDAITITTIDLDSVNRKVMKFEFQEKGAKNERVP